MPRIIPGYVTVATIAAVMLSTLPAFASIESRTLTREGYRLAYALQFSNSLAVLEKACQADRHDAAAPRAIAAITWMEILFAQGAATFAAFDGDASSDDVIRPVAPAYLAERFIRHIEEAVQLAETGAALRPQEIDAQYQLGATRGLLALYRGTVEGRAASAFSDGRRAVKAMTRILEKQPGHREAALIPGIYRYAVSTLSWPKRMLAAAAGMPGDRAGGILMLETAADSQADTATDAALVLMIIYNREGRHADALRHLTQLQLRHPENRLIRLNIAATALAASRHVEAERQITAGLAMSPVFEEPPVAGERALWFYTRGAARMALGQHDGLADLRESMAAAPRDWVRGRTHVALGKIALRAGDTKTAYAELEAAVQYGRRAGDQAVVEEAKRLRGQLLAPRQATQTHAVR